MTQWEYWQLRLRISAQYLQDGAHEDFFAKRKEVLNTAIEEFWGKIDEAGRNGWELVGPLTLEVDYDDRYPDYAYHYAVFKRQKRQIS